MLNFPRPRSLSPTVFLHPPSAHRHFPVLRPSTCLILLSPLVLVFPIPPGFRPTGFRLSLFLLSSSGGNSLAASACLLPQPSPILISLFLSTTPPLLAKSSTVYLSCFRINFAPSLFFSPFSLSGLFSLAKWPSRPSQRVFLLLLLCQILLRTFYSSAYFIFLPYILFRVLRSLIRICLILTTLSLVIRFIFTIGNFGEIRQKSRGNFVSEAILFTRGLKQFSAGYHQEI